ncbi:MAG: AMP-binding protein [Nevskia sp.]|nr:AMP-binding protein [Nevskia sp.]
MQNPDYKATLPACLLYWEKTRPDAVYLTQPQADGSAVDYTWRQVGDQARRMAAYLRSLDLPPRSQIALLGKNSAHWIMADLAIWLAGHVSVPLYPTLNAQTAAYILEHSEARLLFVGKMDELWPLVAPGIPAQLPRITLPLGPSLQGVRGWDEIVAQTPRLETVAKREPDELATVIYTSGSTGLPKGVMISFGAMVRTVCHGDRMFKINRDDRMLSYLPLAHAAERALVEAPSLYHGFRVYFAWSLETFVQDLRRARPTLFFSVPRLWTKFQQGICQKLPLQRQKRLFRVPVLSRVVKRRILSELGLQDVRLALTGSAPLAPALIEWYRKLGLELLEGYAMSENFAYSHSNMPGDMVVGTVGCPAPGVEQRIADNGEILVKSPSDMMGYFKDPQKTAESFTEDGFLKTGDMGSLDDQGRLKITGRVKELFKTAKGKYVAPVPIENRLGRNEKIEAVCVAGAGQPQPFALLLLGQDARTGERSALDAELAGLLREVNAVLEEHEKLDYLVVVKEPWTMQNGYLTPTMKVRRNVVEGRYLSQADGWREARQEVVWE